MRYLILSALFLSGCLGESPQKRASCTTAFYSGEHRGIPRTGGYLSVKNVDGSHLSCAVFFEFLGTSYPLPVRLWTAHHCVDKQFSIVAAAGDDHPVMTIFLSGKYHVIHDVQLEQIDMDRAMMRRILDLGQDDSSFSLLAKTSYAAYRQEMSWNILGKEPFTSCSSLMTSDTDLCSALEDTVTMLGSIPRPIDAQVSAGLLNAAQEYLVARDLEYTKLPGLEDFIYSMVTLEKYRTVFRVVALHSRIKACKAGENVGGSASSDCQAAKRLADDQSDLLPSRFKFSDASISRADAADLYHSGFIDATKAYKTIRRSVKFNLMSNIQFSKPTQTFSPGGYFAIPLTKMFSGKVVDYDSGFSIQDSHATPTTMKPGDSGSIWSHNGVVPILSVSSVKGEDVYIRDRSDIDSAPPPDSEGHGFVASPAPTNQTPTENANSAATTSTVTTSSPVAPVSKPAPRNSISLEVVGKIINSVIQLITVTNTDQGKPGNSSTPIPTTVSPKTPPTKTEINYDEVPVSFPEDQHGC